MARWSSGQDGGLSRRKREFDSPTGHQLLIHVIVSAKSQATLLRNNMKRRFKIKPALLGFDFEKETIRS